MPRIQGAMAAVTAVTLGLTRHRRRKARTVHRRVLSVSTKSGDRIHRELFNDVQDLRDRLLGLLGLLGLLEPFQRFQTRFIMIHLDSIKVHVASIENHHESTTCIYLCWDVNVG